jgi:hypothetical protein
VNLGGWLNLEDWFFSGSAGTDVSTPDNIGQGACLPPLVEGPLDEKWPSEGVLVHRLIQKEGHDRTIEIFRQFRESFVTTDDLDDIKSLGVQMVRVPLNWVAFADALSPINETAYGNHDPDSGSTIVPDPFYHENVSFVTIPRNFLAEFLRNCSARGFKVLLDLHAFPAGSSQGTYNGIYPNTPVFWWNNSRTGNTSVALTDAGQMIVKKMIDWIENDLDSAARSGVGGVTVMNEPGHILADKLDSQVLLNWIAKAADTFRNSHLPDRGVKLYVNLIATAIPGGNAAFHDLVSPWWEKTFTDAERNIWAVLDIHNYEAWEPECEGHPASANISQGYKCNGSHDEIRNLLASCLSTYMDPFAERYKGLKACSEFSIGTAAAVATACDNQDVLSLYLAEQVLLYRQRGIEPFFWTYKMPYGPNFEPGWSYQSHVGLAKKPQHQCNPPKKQQHRLGLPTVI